MRDIAGKNVLHVSCYWETKTSKHSKDVYVRGARELGLSAARSETHLVFFGDDPDVVSALEKGYTAAAGCPSRLVIVRKPYEALMYGDIVSKMPDDAHFKMGKACPRGVFKQVARIWLN